MSVALVVSAICILVVLIAGITMAFAVRRYWSDDRKHSMRVKLSEWYENMRTGDLLFFVSSVNHLTNLFTGCFYTHVGVVLRGEKNLAVPTDKDDMGLHEMFISESTMHHDPPSAIITPLLTKLKDYEGTIYVSPCRGVTPAEEAALWAAARAREGQPYPRAVDALVGLTLDHPEGREVAAPRHCFQHAAYLLDHAGITQGLEGCGFCGTARAISDLHRGSEKLVAPHGYSPPMQLLYDI